MTILDLLAWVPTFPVALILLSFVGGERLAPIIKKAKMGSRGSTNGILIFVRKGIDYEASTIAHERQHVKDMWRMGLVGFGLWRMFDGARARRWAETRGYAVSVKNGRPMAEAAATLAKHYGEDYNKAEAAIREAMRKV